MTPRPSRDARFADLPRRTAIAVPIAAAAVLAVVAGGAIFAAGVAAIGALAVAELYRLLHVPAPAAAAGIVLTAALPLAALYGGGAVVGALAVAVPILFLVSLAARAGGTVVAEAPAFGVLWIGVGLAHGVLLRDLDHGSGLVIDVLLAIYVGDTAAHLVGSAWGRARLAPRISPSKTWEGAAAGIVVGTAATVVAGAFQPWLGTVDSIAIGLAAALAAPLGDLFESSVKRRAGVKDSGRLFGPHGGVLDRVDATLFAAVAGYYVASAVL